ncbi:S24/S26 family peptidase [Desulfococcaceae bacterium HSG9]|nr:S24/S26 family peptidase [Desulfococcaceae bacterium HSG9]
MSASLTEMRRIPPWIKANGLTRCFIYNGPSMRPAFRPGDMLYVRPAVRDIYAGNVIVFTDPVRGRIVHRIISATGTGWVTRGDNNRLKDVLPVTPDLLIGRAEITEFQGRFRIVRGGRRGLWTARIQWRACWVKGWLYRIFRVPYHVLRSSVTVRRFLIRWFSHHLGVVRIETSDGLLVKTTYKGRTVARWQPRQKYFECRKPFDLLVAPPNRIK